MSARGTAPTACCSIQSEGLSLQRTHRRFEANPTLHGERPRVAGNVSPHAALAPISQGLSAYLLQFTVSIVEALVAVEGSLRLLYWLQGEQNV